VSEQILQGRPNNSKSFLDENTVAFFTDERFGAYCRIIILNVSQDADLNFLPIFHRLNLLAILGGSWWVLIACKNKVLTKILKMIKLCFVTLLEILKRRKLQNKIDMQSSLTKYVKIKNLPAFYRNSVCFLFILLWIRTS